jgi:hypothetical protein
MESNDFEFVSGSKTSDAEMIRRISGACADFPDEEEKDFLRLSNANAAKLAEDDDW